MFLLPLFHVPNGSKSASMLGTTTSPHPRASIMKPYIHNPFLSQHRLEKPFTSLCNVSDDER